MVPCTSGLRALRGLSGSGVLVWLRPKAALCLCGSTGRLVRSLTVAARFQTVLLWSNSEDGSTTCSTYLRGLGVLGGKILPGPRTALLPLGVSSF